MSALSRLCSLATSSDEILKGAHRGIEGRALIKRNGSKTQLLRAPALNLIRMYQARKKITLRALPRALSKSVHSLTQVYFIGWNQPAARGINPRAQSAY